MLNWFKPTWMVESIYDLSPEKLKQHGICAVFSDLDNTLQAWNNPEASRQVEALNEKFKKAGIRLVVISNNTKHRVATALHGFPIDFTDWSLKPSPAGILRALKHYHLRKDQVVMVGDQLLTDILAAHNARVRSIWVKPLIKTDKWDTRINRFFEKRIVKKLKQKYTDFTWKKDLNDGKH